MTITLEPTAIGIAVSIAAVVIWSYLLLRSAAKYGHEQRRLWFAMPVGGLIASVGTLASAWAGYASVHGIVFDPVAISFIASMGRGALLMGGIVAIFYYQPGPRAKR